ncbi:hypothetical protein O7627_20525 [Solwaraspora sp. WMMD1047]|uniref:hypothetical protein n=1 Tax=Solwaraspora sp. WMMD1047 TaxID=3016102 RepID=UPI002417815D|nr:hypothetical protein [Solwaraspora sp. WMMD1047]MDG4831670.1 hypothetical protein [Solwaraspora sp. WMMD1047]
MGDTVEIYLRHPGPGQLLAHRVAEALDLIRYFDSGEDYVLPVDAHALIGADGWGQLTLAATDLDDAESAYAAYDFELSLDYRGPREQLGRAIFDRLTGLDLPMVYGDYLRVFADFQPGQGVREFPAQTPAGATGRDVWADRGPIDVRPTSAAPTAGGRVVVFATGSLLQIVPMADRGGRWDWSGPVAALLRTVSDRHLGLLLTAALHPSTSSSHVGGAVLVSAASGARLSTVELFQGRSCVEIRSESGQLVVAARGPGVADTPGALIVELTGHRPADMPPEALGEMVRHLLDQLAARLETAGRE